MSLPPLLHLPYFSVTFIVESDASGRGICVILSQKVLPIAYFDETLKDNVKPVNYEKEMVTIIKVV